MFLDSTNNNKETFWSENPSSNNNKPGPFRSVFSNRAEKQRRIDVTPENIISLKRTLPHRRSSTLPHIVEPTHIRILAAMVTSFDVLLKC